MKTKNITSNLIQMTRLRFVNAYLVREADGFTLIDTTLPGAAEDLIAIAEKADGAIRRVALTHGHGDHAGSVDALKQQLRDYVEVLIPELDARILAGETVADAERPPGSWPKVETVPDVRLKAGERVGSLEVVPAPGHTPGHIAFLDTRDRTLIAGDLFTSVGGLAVTSHFNIRFPFAAMATWDKQRDVESARAVRALDPGLLAVGHGPVVRSPAAAIDRAIARAAS